MVKEDENALKSEIKQSAHEHIC